MAVTKYKDDEKRSSSMYAIWDGAEPVVDFQNFIEDNESIVDVVSYFAMTMSITNIGLADELFVPRNTLVLIHDMLSA